VSIEATQVETLSFAHDAELVEAMQNGAIKTLSWRLEKSAKG